MKTKTSFKCACGRTIPSCHGQESKEIDLSTVKICQPMLCKNGTIAFFIGLDKASAFGANTRYLAALSSGSVVFFYEDGTPGDVCASSIDTITEILDFDAVTAHYRCNLDHELHSYIADIISNTLHASGASSRFGKDELFHLAVRVLTTVRFPRINTECDLNALIKVRVIANMISNTIFPAVSLKGA